MRCYGCLGGKKIIPNRVGIFPRDVNTREEEIRLSQLAPGHLQSSAAFSGQLVGIHAHDTLSIIHDRDLRGISFITYALVG